LSSLAYEKRVGSLLLSTAARDPISRTVPTSSIAEGSRIAFWDWARTFLQLTLSI